MKHYKTASFRLRADGVAAVEEAMRVHAIHLQQDFPNVFWWNGRQSGKHEYFLTLIVFPDEATMEAVLGAAETQKFMILLQAYADEDVSWTEWSTVTMNPFDRSLRSRGGNFSPFSMMRNGASGLGSSEQPGEFTFASD